MAERPCELGDYKGVGNLWLNFRLKGNVSRQYLRIVRWGRVILQLCRWKFSHKETFSRVYSIETEFYLKKQKIAFGPPFGGIGGNVRTPSIVHWKARF